MKKFIAIIYSVLFYKRYTFLFALIGFSYIFTFDKAPLDIAISLWLALSSIFTLFIAVFLGPFIEFISESVINRYGINYKEKTLDRRSHSGDSWSDYEIILDNCSFKLHSVQYFGMYGEKVIINRAIIVKYLWNYKNE